jgi:hypothetical protein
MRIGLTQDLEGELERRARREEVTGLPKLRVRKRELGGLVGAEAQLSKLVLPPEINLSFYIFGREG